MLPSAVKLILPRNLADMRIMSGRVTVCLLSASSAATARRADAAALLLLLLPRPAPPRPRSLGDSTATTSRRLIATAQRRPSPASTWPQVVSVRLELGSIIHNNNNNNNNVLFRVAAYKLH